MKDFAPGHFGDVDRFLQKAGSEEADGWKEKRKAKLIEAKSHRAIVPAVGIEANPIHVVTFLCTLVATCQSNSCSGSNLAQT